MNGHRLATSLHAGALLAVLGGVAWASGQPFVFPSLGPSAFVLALEGGSRQTRPRRVLGGHLIGAVAGFASYWLLAAGVTLVGAHPPLSPAGLRLAASGSVSVVLTSWGMLATDAVHAPACATTLIVSLGLLSTPAQVTVVALGVAVLVAVHAVVSNAVARVTDGPPSAASGEPDRRET